MKKNVKLLVAAALVSMVAGSGLFAQTAGTSVQNNYGIEASEKVEIVTLTGTVKISGKDIMYFKTKDGNTYVINIQNSEEVSTKAIKARKNKKLILSGYINKETKVFNVVKVGGMGTSNNAAK